MIHSNSFPALFTESVYIVIRFDKKLLFETKIDITDRVGYHDFFIPLERVIFLS